MTTPEKPGTKLSRPEHRRYWSGQVWGRRARLLRDKALWVSLALGPLITFVSYRVPGGDLDIADVSSAGLSYAAIAFGACVTGAVLALTLPATESVRRWSTTAPKEASFSNYSDLVFVFTWSAVAQLAVIVISLGGDLFGSGVDLAPQSPWLSHVVAQSLSLSIAAYAMAQLFTVVSTISQIAFVTIDEANRPTPQAKPPADDE